MSPQARKIALVASIVFLFFSLGTTPVVSGAPRWERGQRIRVVVYAGADATALAATTQAVDVLRPLTRGLRWRVKPAEGRACADTALSPGTIIACIGPAALGNLGQTVLQTRNGKISSARITLYPKDGAISTATVLHELIHGIGGTHSHDPTSIMYWQDLPGQTLLTADRAWLKHAYPKQRKHEGKRGRH